MHDFIFEHGINTISIKKIYLMVGFRPSYVFIPLGFFFHKNHGILAVGRWEDIFFALGGTLLWRTLVGETVSGMAFFSLRRGII